MSDMVRNRLQQQQDLMLFFDDEASSKQRQQAEALAAQDQDMAALLDQWSELGDVICEVTDQHAVQAGADDIIDGLVAKIDELQSGGEVVPFRRRRPWLGALGGLAGLAAAAAAVLVVWTGVVDRTAKSERSASTDVAAPSVQLLASAPVRAEQADNAERVQGVQVDAVDFGASAGAVFYVPADNGTMTAVVWLSDDETGGSE